HPRATTIEKLASLPTPFREGGSVTAGNASGVNDGAAAIIIASKDAVEKYGLTPIARITSMATVGVPPRIMGIGPAPATQALLDRHGLTIGDIDFVELNEAFASQSLAVIRELGMNPETVNVNGGAISLGHPLGCTGAKLSVQLFNEMKRRKNKYGLVTMCVGTEEQNMMKEAVIEFIDREVWPERERFENKDYAFTEELMRKAGEMGFLGVSIPENYGGIGMGFVSTMLVTDYISSASGSLGTAYGAHTGIGTMPIFLYGTEEQKNKYLPVLTAGEKFGAYCLTEPGAGSDANSGKTTATLTEDGKHYLINGQKMWISNAGFAEIFIVFARIEDDKNITGFLLEYDKENPNGVTFGEEEKKLGITSSSTRQVFFNDTKIPVENMLSERGKGFKIALNSLNVGRIKLAAACLDASRRTITESVRYANERIQFKQPISSFGAIQAKLAEMSTRT
ncbi:unnamed protein product, partial [Cyprideis torosa]